MQTHATQALASWREEKRSAWLYRVVSDAESGSTRQVLFLELAQAADGQARLWEAELHKLGVPPPTTFTPDLRARLVAGLIPRLGVRPLKGVLAAMKVRGMSLYTGTTPHGTPTNLEQMRGERHKNAGSGSLRAAVFGVNDGLISNASLILGVAGAGAAADMILLSGVAGLLAGAFSMAAGEYVSMRSQREFHEYQIALEREELDQYPGEEAAELALIYQAKGVAPEEARRMAQALIADPDQALDTLAREELGLNPDELGSPWAAALSSFVAFGIGALVPLLPYMLLSGANAFYRRTGGHRHLPVRRRRRTQPVHRPECLARRHAHAGIGAAAGRQPGSSAGVGIVLG
jgi:VIT1/CCC1 family predicted Fe2+/Mn2+ transporter